MWNHYGLNMYSYTMHDVKLTLYVTLSVLCDVTWSLYVPGEEVIQN